MPEMKDAKTKYSISKDGIVIATITASLFLPIYMCAIPVVCFLIRVLSDRALMRKMAQVPYVGFLAAFCVLTLAVSVANGRVESIAVAGALTAAMAVAVYLRVVMTKDLLFGVLHACCWGALLTLAVALVQLVLYADVAGYRCMSVYSNPNYYAMMMEFIALIALYLWVSGQPQRLLYAAALLACLVGLYLSNSRAAMVTAIASALILVLLMRRTKAFLYCMVGCAILGAIMLAFPELFRLNTNDQSMDVRQLIWKTGIEGFVKSPVIGYGAWSYGHIAAQVSFGFPEVHAHNLLLELLLTSGLLGTALLATYFVGNHVAVYKLHRKEKDHDLMALVYGITMALMLHGLFDVTIFIPQTAFLLLMVCSVSGLLEREVQQVQAVPVHVHVPWLVPPVKPRNTSAQTASTEK